jgi:hypothetical protein
VTNRYVYEYRIDGCVRYVGKGTNERAETHLGIATAINSKRAVSETVTTTRWLNFLAKALREGTSVEVIRVAENLKDEQAWEKEVELIAHYGRAGIDGGLLYNELAGGDGTTSADMKRLWAAETIALIGDFEKAARRQGWTPEEMQHVLKECTEEEQINLLRTLMNRRGVLYEDRMDKRK